MSTVQTIHREIADLWNARDYEGMRALLHPDYTYTATDGTESPGPEACLAVAKMYGDAFPDAKLELKRLHIAGETSIAEFFVQGTHNGRLMDIAPTGKVAQCVLCNIIEMRGGKVYRERDYFDPLSIMIQIGAIPGRQGVTTSAA